MSVKRTLLQSGHRAGTYCAECSLQVSHRRLCKMFEQMEQDKIISTRGLKPDAVKYGELVFDVNSAYFYNHGGYEFAKQFLCRCL